MPNNTYTGAAAGAWETGGNWSLGHKPTGTESAIINANRPAAPVADETVQDITYSVSSGASLDASVHLTITGNVTVTNTSSTATLSIKAQTGAGGTVTASNSLSFIVVAGNIAGSVVATGGAVTATNFNGSVTTTSAASINGKVNAAFTSSGSDATLGDATTNIDWGPAATCHFTGPLGVVYGKPGGTEAGPASVTADFKLTIMANPSMGGFDFSSRTITAGGTLLIIGDPNNGILVNIASAVIVGPSLANAFYDKYVTTGSPASVTGFGPAYKIGAGALQVGAYAGFIHLPAQSTVQQSTAYGPSDGLTGTLTGGGGGSGLSVGF